jgi:hypothetical protein
MIKSLKNRKKNKGVKRGGFFTSKKKEPLEPLKYDFTNEEASRIENLYCDSRAQDEEQCSPEDMEKFKIISKIKAQMRLDQFPGKIEDYKKMHNDEYRKLVNGSDIIKKEGKDVTGSKLRAATGIGVTNLMRYITGGKRSKKTNKKTNKKTSKKTNKKRTKKTSKKKK